jgi:hypothetical protein
MVYVDHTQKLLSAETVFSDTVSRSEAMDLIYFQGYTWIDKEYIV